jgi:hypothetical protein
VDENGAGQGFRSANAVLHVLRIGGIFGPSEYALRASNIPWFAVAAIAMTSIFPKKARLKFSVLMLTLTNAFLWYYLSEARSYIVLAAFSAVTTACLLRLLADQSSANSAVWFSLFCVGLGGLCATSLIAVPWAISNLKLKRVPGKNAGAGARRRAVCLR